MNKRVLTGALVMVTSVMLSVSTIAFADKDKDKDKDKDGSGIFARTSTIPAVTNKLYVTECGACHFAYQPGWLPARSWRSMMGSLEQHFGENAELDTETRLAITRYLEMGAADVKQNRKSRKIMRSIGRDEAPLRISTLRYMVNKHDEIPKRLIEGNAKVGSRANCTACHAKAASGYFDEHGVNIPGYGPWED